MWLNYSEVKKRLRQVNALCTAGKLSEADALVKGMTGRGMSRQDFHNRVHPEHRAALRAYAKA